MSAADHPLHRRLIVELWHGGADARTLRAIAAVAALLDLDLHGLFIEDAALFDLAALPFVRELRLPTHEWQTMEAGRIAQELRHAAATSQRMLREVATALGVANAFEIRRGEPDEALAAITVGGDIVVVCEPATLGSRLSSGAARLQSAAHASGASLLFLPTGFKPRSGPIVAVVDGSADPALALATRAAINTKERLLLLAPDNASTRAEDAVQRAIALGVPRSRIAARDLAAPRAEDILHALAHVHEQLLVLTRQAPGPEGLNEAARLAAERGVPVLLV
jgi:hypothetical protein